MKKYLILFLLFIPLIVSAQENYQYIQLFNCIDSNMYRTGMYSISMYDVDDVSDIYIENYDNSQIVGIVIISSHKYSSLALFELMRPFIGSKNSYYDDGNGIFITNRGMIISDMRWGAIIISKSVLLSNEPIREIIYSSLINQYCSLVRIKENKKDIFEQALDLINQYHRYKEHDPILLEIFTKSIETELENIQ